jgi:hypothetical protein
MTLDDSLLPQKRHIPEVTADSQSETAEVVATRDHTVIRQWAERQSAAPATGEATGSGPATVTVNDGGAGIRFNFPAAGRFREISWDEWFANFDRHELLFVFDNEPLDAAPNARYRIVKAAELDGK